MSESNFALAHLTSLATQPLDFLVLGERLGFDYIGLRLLPAAPGGIFYPLQSDKKSLMELQQVLTQTHCQVFDIEIVRLGERTKVPDFESLFATGQALNARAVLVAGDDPEPNRLADTFARLCELGQEYHLHCQLEFMPWTAVANLSQALHVWRQAGEPVHGGVLVDSLHFFRSSSRLDELSTVPAQAMKYVQLSDQVRTIPTSTEAMIFDARCERLAPGDGELALRELMARLPPLPISLEIPHEEKIKQMGVEAWASDCLKNTKELLN